MIRNTPRGRSGKLMFGKHEIYFLHSEEGFWSCNFGGAHPQIGTCQPYDALIDAIVATVKKSILIDPRHNALFWLGRELLLEEEGVLREETAITFQKLFDLK
jgi:hypothetical protein